MEEDERVEEDEKEDWDESTKRDREIERYMKKKKAKMQWTVASKGGADENEN